MERVLTAPRPGNMTAGGPLGVLARLARKISGMIERDRSRRGLLHLSDRDLRDIAVTRRELGSPAAFGSSRDLSDRLAQRSGSRSGPW